MQPVSNEVHFVLPVGASWTQLIKAQATFLEILREVSRSVAGTVDDPVDWVVRRVSESSADIAAVPVPVLGTNLPQASLHEMAEAVPAGVKSLAEGRDRPRHFSERALKLTTSLTKILPSTLPPIRTRNGAGDVEITKAAAKQAERILATPYVTEIGTVEGILKRFDVADPSNRMFVIYDEITGAKIECHFAHRVASEVIGAAAERRVAVTGEIRSREWGEIISVIVHRDGFAVLPFDAELPTFDDVRGILAR